jgi:hypothetical protein
MRGASARMLRPSFLARRMGSAWLLVSCLMLSVFVTTALVAALLSFYTAALPATVSRELVKSRTLSISISDQASGSAAGATRLVSTKLRSALGSVRYQFYKAVWSNDIALPGSHSGGNLPALQAAAVSGISAHAALTSGTWPAAPQAGRPIPVALPQQVGSDLKVGVGSVLKLRYVGTKAPVRLAVTGLFRPRDPAGSYWRLDLIGPSGVTVGSGFASYGPAVVSPAAFSPMGGGRPAVLQANEASFVALPAVRSFGPGDLDRLAARIDALVASLQTDGVSLVSTTMPQTLVNAAEGLAAAKSLVVISGLQLLLLAAAALALAGRLLASHRDEESALLAARGASRWQLVRPSLTEGVLTCAAAAAAGTIVGVRLAALLLSNLVGPGLQQKPPGEEAWLGTAVILVLCLGVALWPALRPPAIGVVRIRRGRQAAVASAVAVGADVALVALAVLSVHELLSYSAAAGGTGVDPVIVAAPALALAGLALIPLRLLPVAAKGLDKLTARGRRLGPAMASWEISRRPVRQSGPALLVILAVGTSTLALTQYQSWRQSVHDQAAFAAGAQVRIGLAGAEPLSAATQITRLRGVTAAMPVSQQSLGTGQLLAIGGPQAAATVTIRRDLSAPVPVSTLWSYLDQRQGPSPGLAVPGRPERIEITASMVGGPAGQLGPVAVTVTVQDAYGLAYELPAGTMAANGRPQRLVVQLVAPAGPTSAGATTAGATTGRATTGSAAYPLRLLGLSLSYNMPPNPAALATDGNSVISLRSLSASPSLTAPFGAPFAFGRALAGWRVRTSSPGLETIIGRLGGQSDGSLKPAVVTWAAAGQDARMTLDPGNGPVLHPPATLARYGVTTLPAEVQFTIPPPILRLPLIATSAFLRANGMSAGASVPISIAGVTVSGNVIATVADFPTITAGGAVVADQRNLQDALISAGGVPLPATAWWLSTTDGKPPPDLPSGSSVVDAAALAAGLKQDPLWAAPIKAALAVGAAAALLAVVGFCVSVAASARARRSQRALLSALGVPGRAQAGLFCLEEIMVSGPAALVGLVVGIGLAHVLIPAITLTATAGLPVPPVLVRIPTLWVALIVVAVPAIPVLAAAVTTLRRPDPAAELRAAEAAG